MTTQLMALHIGPSIHFGLGRMLGDKNKYSGEKPVRVRLYPYTSTRRQQTPTNRSSHSVAATGSPACQAVSTAADVAILGPQEAVTAHVFDTKET